MNHGYVLCLKAQTERVEPQMDTDEHRSDGLRHEWWARQKTAEGLSDGAHMARRKFTREFKVSAVKLVNEQGYTIPAAAKSLGVDPNGVRGWVAK